MKLRADVFMGDLEQDWDTIRQQVLERDHYTCRGCGISEEKCNRSLDVHHIIPTSKKKEKKAVYQKRNATEV